MAAAQQERRLPHPDAASDVPAVPLAVLSQSIQPIPSLSGIYDAALMELRMAMAACPRVRPMDAGSPACWAEETVWDLSQALAAR
jgi:hypothetical protein